jgi:dTMP kinase
LPLDRLEREDDGFFARIADAYRDLAEAEPQRVRRIDASQPPERVLAAALQELRDLL